MATFNHEENGDKLSSVDNKKKKAEIIQGLMLSIFNEDGPTPLIYWPNDMDEMARLLIAMKTISLLMCDSTYQDGVGSDGVSCFGVIPFPDLHLNGLTYFFLIADKKSRGGAKATTITVLISEDNNSFFYENMKYLRVAIDKTATQIQNANSEGEYKKIMEELKEDLFQFTKELKDPFSAKRKIKILYTGLDRAGKTSFLLAIKKKYSEIIKALPTKGVERTDDKIFEEQSSEISIWDLGGQRRYLDRFLEQSKIYLYNVDLMFFFIDVQDTERREEAVELFEKIVSSLRDLDEYPPLIICLNKFDPDLKDSKGIKKNLKFLNEEITRCSEGFFIKIFTTSIFDHWSLISAYSYGLSQLSPNREWFRNQLRTFARKTNSDALLLLNENGIILSNYSNMEISDKVFEISAPHFQTLYKTFKEFKLLKQDFIVSSGITEDSKKVIFKKIRAGKYNLYLLLFLQEYIGIEKKIEENLVEFSNNLAALIQTYI